MGYVTDEQKTLIKMMYGHHEEHDDFQETLDEFGKIVEKNVLPVETATDEQRAQNFGQDLMERLKQKGKYTKTAVGETVDDMNKAEKIPEEALNNIVEFGLTAMPFPEELGGFEFPYPLFIACLETLGKASPSIGVRYAISNTCTEGLKFNNEAGKLSEHGKETLLDLIEGKKLAAFGLTESGLSGSDVMKEMKTRATLSEDGKHYILNGGKMFITNTGLADLYTVFAKTSDDPRAGVSLFLVEPDIKGFSIGQYFEKRVIRNTTLGELLFDNAEVPVENVIGDVGSGFKSAIRMLNSGRVTIAALAVGLAQRAFEEYMEIAVEGKTIGGKHLAEYDRTWSKIAELSTEINSVRAMTYEAAWLKQMYDQNPKDKVMLNRYVIIGNGAKLKASLVAQKACNYLVQLGGADSVTKENHNMRLLEDSWLTYIGEGVPEALETTIAAMEAKKYMATRGG